MNWYLNVAQFATDSLGGNRGQRPTDDDDQPMFVDGSTTSLADVNGTGMSVLGAADGLSWQARVSESAADRVYTAFDVSQPVDQPQDLRGREAQVAALLSGVLYRRNHGVISGPRGSGKTSLVRVFGQYTDQEGIVVLYSACDNGTNFGDLLRGFLEQIPTSSVDADAVDQFRERVRGFGPDSTPNLATSVLSQIKYSQVIIILDEFDRVTDDDLQFKISSLLKLVSDARLPVRFVLVGDESVFTDIVRGHPSLTRHITRVSTIPLDKRAIFDLLKSCAARCGLRFSEASLRAIEEIACGSPYHARLFGMHAALNAVASGSADVGSRHAAAGIRRAFQEWSSLNADDGAVFLAVCNGEHGDPSPFVQFARRAAGGSEALGGPLGAVDNGGFDPAAFGPAVELDDGHLRFRDATAPQFLIALCRASDPTLSNDDEKGELSA